MYFGGFQFNPNPAMGFIRPRQPPRAQYGVIMAPARTSLPIPAPPALPVGNLEKFLKAVTPWVPARRLSKQGRKRNLGTYFELNDLWESFIEWSVYGAGAPLVLYDDEPVVQYYVPLLSGIQIYGHQKPKPKSRKVSPQDSESSNSCGNLLFQYLEYELPFNRKPLYEKISELASQFPELKSMRSCDLHPNSWFSVAWYPIYRIPSRTKVNELDACFLTYHSLYTPMKGSPAAPGVHAPRVHPDQKSGSPKFALPTIGLSTYKFKPSLWTGNNERSNALVNSLSNEAKNWVERLNVNHPDQAFFVIRR